MAISAFYIHKRSVDQVLDRLIKLTSKPPPPPPPGINNHHHIISDAEEDTADYYTTFHEEKKYWRDDNFLKSSDVINVRNGDLDEEESVGIQRGRVSSSMPNVRIFSNDWADDEDKKDFSNEMDRNLDFISSNLPPLRTHQDDGNN